MPKPEPYVCKKGHKTWPHEVTPSMKKNRLRCYQCRRLTHLKSGVKYRANGGLSYSRKYHYDHRDEISARKRVYHATKQNSWYSKILILDIETQPDLAWVWSVYDTDAISIHQHWQVLSFSAKWYGTTKFITKGRCHYACKDDKALLADAWKLLDEADIVVAHNGKNFDIRKLNARFIAHGMTPPSPYKVVDTKCEIKRVAAFSSNKLDWLCKQLEIGHKMEHEGFQLWLDCMAGDKKAWAKMLKYNQHDVELLEQLYEKVRPWIKQPNSAFGTIKCIDPACGSLKMILRKIIRNSTRSYQMYQCADCGKWARATASERDAESIAKVVGV